MSSLQKRLAGWQRVNFGEPSLEQLTLGVCEEAGELAHAVLKAAQGIRGMEDEHARKDAIADALGDIAIYAMQVAEAAGIDFYAAVEDTAEQVMRRDWRRGGDPVRHPRSDWWDSE